MQVLLECCFIYMSLWDFIRDATWMVDRYEILISSIDNILQFSFDVDWVFSLLPAPILPALTMSNTSGVLLKAWTTFPSREFTPVFWWGPCSPAFSLEFIPYFGGARVPQLLVLSSPRYFGGARVPQLLVLSSPPVLWWGPCSPAFSFLCYGLLCLYSFCVCCPMLPVSLDCPFVNSPSVFSQVYIWHNVHYYTIFNLIQR